jgi:hypothetical protein
VNLFDIIAFVPRQSSRRAEIMTDKALLSEAKTQMGLQNWDKVLDICISCFHWLAYSICSHLGKEILGKDAKNYQSYCIVGIAYDFYLSVLPVDFR